MASQLANEWRFGQVEIPFGEQMNHGLESLFLCFFVEALDTEVTRLGARERNAGDAKERLHLLQREHRAMLHLHRRADGSHSTSASILLSQVVVHCLNARVL